jgi:hypothetical protein
VLKYKFEIVNTCSIHFDRKNNKWNNQSPDELIPYITFAGSGKYLMSGDTNIGEISHTTYQVKLIIAAARSEAWAVFARSNARIVGSNPTQGMHVCVRLFGVCVVLCVRRGLARGWSPVHGVLPIVYRIKKLKNRPRPNKGLYSYIIIIIIYRVNNPSVLRLRTSFSLYLLKEIIVCINCLI